ncbi:hypothetical protein ACIBJE_20125 [Micromonospora sp. NPDC050187]|uniref:hypothetical protein n=1 Tax=Micromonospora sp. NPDC050187 TaxID=3364277 RepID=UPI0037B727E7
MAHLAEAQQLADRMHKVLAGASWTPDDDPDVVISILSRVSHDIEALLTLDNALTVLSEQALADTYLFYASVYKAVRQEHPAKPPERRGMARADFVAETRKLFTTFHQRQQELLAALDEARLPTGQGSQPGV